MVTQNADDYAPTVHNVQVGASNGLLTNVVPSATSGIPFVSKGAAADPAFDTAVVAGGGTGAVTLTGVLVGNGTSPVTATAITQYNVITGGVSNAPNSVPPSATSGVPLISQGAASQPIFGTAVVAGGGTGDTSFTAFSVITGGTTSTAALQNVSGVGTSGQVLTSNGAAMLPTWQAVGTGIGSAKALGYFHFSTGSGSTTVKAVYNCSIVYSGGNINTVTLTNAMSSVNYYIVTGDNVGTGPTTTIVDASNFTIHSDSGDIWFAVFGS